MNTRTNRELFLAEIQKVFGNNPFSRKELLHICKMNNFSNIGWFTNSSEYKISRGRFQILDKNFASCETKNDSNGNLSSIDEKIDSQNQICNFISEQPKQSLVPTVDPIFVKHGEFDLISTIISSKKFYPIFITGLSGNGKTFGVEQACAHSNRELYRVNITIETDEDDLLGGFRLINDSTKWFDGPVIRAMKTGGVLLLDEVDLGSNKLLCLQPVLEGKGILLKKINQFVRPSPGFTVVATANTKGQGSESGKFIGTNILNEAFLERFCATFEQGYPEEKVEKNILKRVFQSMNISDSHSDDFIEKLVTWAFGTRKTYDSGGVSDLISTRRLVHIANAYGILAQSKTDDKKKIGKNRRQAIMMCISRFDDATKASFIAFYEKLDTYLIDNYQEPQSVNPGWQQQEIKISTPSETDDLMKILSS